jgi:hypothetical protein
MKLSSLTFSWLVIALLGFGTLGAVVISYLPAATPGFDAPVADGLVLTALYAGIFLFVLGCGALAGYGLRWRRYQTIYLAHHAAVIRQASLAATGATALMALQGLNVLTWWDGTLLIVALILIELSFQVRPGNIK